MPEHKIVEFDGHAKSRLKNARQTLEEHEKDGWKIGDTIEISGHTKALILVRGG